MKAAQNTVSEAIAVLRKPTLLEISDYSGGEDELEEQEENESGIQGSSYPEESESELK